MNDVYEYRKQRGRGVIWLSAITVVFLLGAILIFGATQFITVAAILGAVMLLWMAMPAPAAGIRVDDEYLTLSAWRKPRQIRLNDIAYLRATDQSPDSDVTVVYKDGREEGTFKGDMPDFDTLAEVMAARGVPVRDTV